MRPLRIAFFGSSLVSAYWNGAATYYRGIISALYRRGHAVTFYEPDAYERQAHRDIEDPPWARVVVYSAQSDAGVRRSLEEARSADLVVKASGVGVFDELLEEEVAQLSSERRMTAFWDVDAPATLSRVQARADEPFRRHIPRYDVILTYGGGPPVVAAYRALGARATVPIYNGLDPSTHHPVPAVERFRSDLGFLGNRLPDREARVERFFLEPARALPHRRFLLGGNGWGDVLTPANVETLGHVYTRDHNAFNASAFAVLNVSRESMAEVGYSPATRVFEAAGAGACLISDAWAGVEEFFEPDREILLARDGAEVAGQLEALTEKRRAAIGASALRRALAHHTYDRRALLLERVLAL